MAVSNQPYTDSNIITLAVRYNTLNTPILTYLLTASQHHQSKLQHNHALISTLEDQSR